MLMEETMMDDRVFDLLEKMYTDLNSKIDGMSKEIQEMKDNMVTKDDLDKTNQSIARLENKMDTNHKALYDGYKQTYEKLTTLENKVDEIDKKVERQDVEIRVIKGVK